MQAYKQLRQSRCLGRRPFASARPAIRSSSSVVAKASPSVAEIEAAAVNRLKSEQPNSSSKDALVQLLRATGYQKSTEPELAEGAMCALEQMAKAQGHPIREEGATVDGQWRLIFSTATKIRFLQYIPVIEDLDVNVASKQMDLASEVGPFRFTFKGNILSWDQAANEMVFDFSQLVVTLFGQQIHTRPVTRKPKTYTFYYISQDLGAVRSSGSAAASGGNVTLFIRKP